MNGIEILSTAEVATASAFNWEFAGWLFLGLVAAGVIVGAIFGIVFEDWYVFVVVLATFACVGLMIGTVGGLTEPVPTAYETQYKITVSDEVSMIEFNEKYEIISQEGKIYTVRERK